MEQSDTYTDNEVYEVDVKLENKVEADKPFKLFERNKDERTNTDDQSRTNNRVR